MTEQPQTPNSGYIVQRLGVETGPVSFEELKLGAASGHFKSESLVRQEGSDAWAPLGALPGVFSRRSLITAAVLAFFLGGLGVDRFYLGYTGLGILKLVTLGACGVWTLIDFILILVRKLPDAEGYPLS